MAKPRGQTGGALTVYGKGDGRFWSARFWRDVHTAGGHIKRVKRSVRLGFCNKMDREAAIEKLHSLILDHEAKEREFNQHLDFVGPRLGDCELRLLGRQIKGRMSELLVSLDLMRRNFEVFEHLSEFASCDLVALIRGTNCILRVEVKYVGPTEIEAFIRRRRLAGASKFDLLAVVSHDGNVKYADASGRKLEGNLMAEFLKRTGQDPIVPHAPSVESVQGTLAIF